MKTRVRTLLAPCLLGTGTGWQGTGVVPDVKVPAADALEAAHKLALEKLGR